MLSGTCGGKTLKTKYTITTGKRPQTKPVVQETAAPEPVKKERKKKNA